MPKIDPSDWGFASDLEDIRGAVAIVGIGDADYTKASGRTTQAIAAQAAERAVGIALAQFDPFAAPAGFFTVIANADAHQSAQNYCASLLPTDKRGVPLVLQNLGNKECDGQPLNLSLIHI